MKMTGFQKALILTVLAVAPQAFSNTSVDTSWVTSDPQVLMEAKALTKTLKRTVTVYSWVSRDNVGRDFPVHGSIDSLNPQIQEATFGNAKDRMSRFWDTSLEVSGRSAEGGAMAPNGLYVATEPVISRTYGGANWVIYQMQLPAGLTFIDGRYRQAPKMGPNLLRALENRGCRNPLTVTSQNPVFAARNLIKADTKQVACRQALNDIAAAVDAKAILYVFKGEPVPNCRAVYAWNSAFVLISPDAVAKGSFYPLVKDRSGQDDGLEDSRRLINATFKNAGQAQPFPGVSEVSAQEGAQMMRDQYFACNPEVREW